jgi:hypothetical protein
MRSSINLAHSSERLSKPMLSNYNESLTARPAAKTRTSLSTTQVNNHQIILSTYNDDEVQMAPVASTGGTKQVVEELLIVSRKRGSG